MLSQRVTNFLARSAAYGEITTHFKKHHSEYAEHTRNVFHCWLRIAYVEWFSTLAEHTRKYLKVEYLSPIEYDFQNLVLQAIGTKWFRFLQKKDF